MTLREYLVQGLRLHPQHKSLRNTQWGNLLNPSLLPLIRVDSWGTDDSIFLDWVVVIVLIQHFLPNS
jgi:hypothetical protein